MAMFARLPKLIVFTIFSISVETIRLYIRCTFRNVNIFAGWLFDIGVFATNGKFGFLALTLLAAVAASGASALETAWQGAPEGEVRLLAAANGFDEGGRVSLGLQFRLQPGWKTYWRHAGDSGAPPIFDWQGSRNLALATVHWPAPARFTAFGYDSFGYDGTIILPIEAIRKANGDDMTVRLRLDYQICEKICLPVTADLSLTVPDAPAASTPHQFVIEEARARIPKTAAAAAFSLEKVALGGSSDKPELSVRMRCRGDYRFADPDLLVEGPENVGFGRPISALSADNCGLDMKLPVYVDKKIEDLSGGALTLTLVDGGEAGEFIVFLK
jgi:suppressor for copper-sensitivity B